MTSSRRRDLPRRVSVEHTADWRAVREDERGVAVVVRCHGGWADGRLGRVVGPASMGPPGSFTVLLDDGAKFLAKPGQALTRPTA